MPIDASSAHAVAIHEPIEVLPGIWRVASPLQARVEPVNIWLLRDGDGLTVFDGGLGIDARARWSHVLGRIGHEPGDVRRIVLSHHHPDHIGGVGSLQRMSGAQVFASRSTIAQAPDVWGGEGRIDSYFDAVRAHLSEHGFPDAVADALEPERGLVAAAIELPEDDAWQPLDEGDRLEVDGRTWRVRLTPGHADGHLVLHDEGEGLLLAGDHLLQRISPAVGRFPRHERDPLARYLESLVRVSMLDVRTVLPGHGAPFEGAGARARELVAHHRDRVDRCVAALDGERATAFDVARVVFSRVFDAPRPDPANQRFATTETLAHLERARFDGRVERARGADGRFRYAAVALEPSGPVR